MTSICTSATILQNRLLAAAFRDVKLTQKQIYLLSEGKKHWSTKEQYLIKLIKNFGYVVTPEQLGYFIEIVVPKEQARIKTQFFIDSVTGKRVNHLTPTDITGNFTIITTPAIGVKYHISWAFSGAVFKLVKVEGDTCYLDNPKYKRETLLKCKVSELRGLR